MIEGKVNAYGAIWSDEPIDVALIDQFVRRFKQPAQHVLVEMAVGSREDRTAGAAEATPREVLTIAHWVFGGLACLATTGEAIEILGHWLDTQQPQAVIVFALSHRDLLEPLKHAASRCGLKWMQWFLVEETDRSQEESIQAIEACSHSDQPTKLHEDRTQLNKEAGAELAKLAKARQSGNTADAERSLERMVDLHRTGAALSKALPVYVGT